MKRIFSKLRPRAHGAFDWLQSANLPLLSLRLRLMPDESEPPEPLPVSAEPSASAPAESLLSDSQRRVVGFAITLFAALSAAALVVLSFVVLTRLVSYFSGVLWPLAVAGILALVLRPVVEILETKFKVRRLGAVILLYGAFVLLVTIVLVLFLPPLIAQIIDFIIYLPKLWASVVEYVHLHYPSWVELAQRQLENPTVRRIADSLATEAQDLMQHALPSLRKAGGGILSVFGFAAHLAIIPIYLFFFLLSRREPTHKLPRQLTFLRPAVREDVVFLVREFIAIVVSFFRGQLVIGLIMGVLLAIGFTLVGLKFGLFFGLVLGFLNIVPYFGTIVGLIVTLPVAFFQPDGGIKLVGLMLVVYIIVQNIEGWFLTPKIMSDRTGLHPIAIIVAIFFWGTVFQGILGMVLAIPLTAFFVTAWRLAKRKYFTV